MDSKPEKTDKMSRYIAIAASVVCFCVLSGGAYMLSRSMLPGVSALPAMSSAAVGATVSPVVTDALTGAPVAGAVIVIPEAGSESVTDATGSAGAIPVPVNTDERFAKILPQPWGEVTLIVYADGYIPYALFNLMVSDVAREGPNIMLFKKSVAEGDAPFSIIEGPHREWVNALVEKYAP